MRGPILLVATMMATAAGAQSTSQADSGSKSVFRGWSGRLTASARPTFGTDLPDEVNRDLVDEAEAEAALRFTKNLAANLDFQFRAGATYAPNYFDGDDGRSAFYGQVSVGERESPLTYFRALESADLSKFQDTFTPYVRYRYIRAYEGFFDRVKANDHRLTVGLTYVDIRGIMCSDAEWRRLQNKPDVEGLCTGDKGLYWELEGNFNHLESDDPLREKSFATVRAKGLTRPLRYGLRLFAEVGGEAHFFSHERVLASGRRREDQLARITIGLDVSTPLKRMLGVGGNRGLDASVGARWEQNWSNRADKRYERGFALPVFSIWTNF